MIFRSMVFFAAAGAIVLDGHFACLPNRAANFVQAGEGAADREHAATPNPLRNGSFEGGLLYWHGVDSDKQTLVRGGAAVGEYALRIDRGFVMSAPFAARRGEPVTVSFFVRGDKPGTVDVSMPPSAREVGQKAGRLWTRGAGQTAKFGTEWQRVSFTWNADVPQDGFWPNPHVMVDNVYGIPSGVNRAFFNVGGLKVHRRRSCSTPPTRITA